MIINNKTGQIAYPCLVCDEKGNTRLMQLDYDGKELKRDLNKYERLESPDIKWIEENQKEMRVAIKERDKNKTLWERIFGYGA